MEGQRGLSRRSMLAGAGSMMAIAACGGKTGTSAKTTTTIAATSPASSGAGNGLYVPPAAGDWEKADPAATGWQQAKLDQLAATVAASNTRTFVMLAGGRLLVEQYSGGATAESTQDIASAQKSVTATLVGIAKEKGQLTLDDTITSYLGSGWSNATPAEEAPITIRHLLTMSSGLNPNTLKKTSAPGTVWAYNTEAYQKLRTVLEKAVGQDVNSLTREFIFDPIGVSTATVWANRGGSTDATGDALFGIRAPARDMARFGLLTQRLGNWDGTQVVSEAWIREAWTPDGLRPDYGFLWWLLGKRQRFTNAGAPGDWVAALGAQDQKIYVIPSLDLVVTRQGLAAKEVSDTDSEFDMTLITGILEARA